MVCMEFGVVAGVVVATVLAEKWILQLEVAQWVQLVEVKQWIYSSWWRWSSG